MRQLDTIDGIAIIAFVIIISSCIILVTGLSLDDSLPVVRELDVESSVGCDSDSMGVSLRCGTKIYGRYIDEDETIFPGSIYVYNTSSNIQVIHRLVLCLDAHCDKAVFKGDNNAVGEIVERKDILYRVTLVEQ